MQVLSEEGTVVTSARWEDVMAGKLVWKRDSFKCSSLHVGPSSAITLCVFCQKRTGPGTGATLQLGCVWILRDDGERTVQFREAAAFCCRCFMSGYQIREVLDCLFISDWEQATQQRTPGRGLNELGAMKEHNTGPPNILSWAEVIILTGYQFHCHSTRYIPSNSLLTNVIV